MRRWPRWRLTRDHVHPSMFSSDIVKRFLSFLLLPSHPKRIRPIRTCYTPTRWGLLETPPCREQNLDRTLYTKTNVLFLLGRICRLAALNFFFVFHCYVRINDLVSPSIAFIHSVRLIASSYLRNVYCLIFHSSEQKCPLNAIHNLIQMSFCLRSEFEKPGNLTCWPDFTERNGLFTGWAEALESESQK